MSARTVPYFVLAVVILALSFDTVLGSEARPDHSEHNVSGNDTDGGHGDGEHHDGGHHGVRLASWRWDEYSNLIIVTLMVIIAGVLKLAFHHTPILANHFPESCVLIVIGVIIGLVIYMGIESHSHHFPAFTSELFFNVLLPPIILDAAYALYDRDFLANLGSVILFAVVGTLFNVFAIGGLLYLMYYVGAMGSFDMVLDPIQCLIFSSLISAVDPVAVLAIFEEIGVNMGLYFLVFGESLLNDGVTVVLYNTMIALSAQEEIDYTQYILAFFSFFTVVFGGLAVGMILGAICAFILKFTKHTRVIEPLIIFAMSYLSFILAETIHWSGIISLIGCGIMQKRYAFPNISKKSYTTVKYSVKTLAAFSDCIIFLFLGIVTVSHTLAWHTGFVLWTVFLCTVIRFTGVFSLSWLINKRSIRQISHREQFIMAYGGLRGAVGFSLVTILDPSDPWKDIFLTTTLVMIFFTVFIQGGTIKLLVGKLNIEKKVKEVKMISEDVNEKTIDHVMAGVESVIGRRSRYTILEKIRRFDKDYTKKLLIRKDAEDLLTLRFQRYTLDDHYARLYGPAVMIHQHHEEAAAADDGGGDHHKEFTETERKKLRLALQDTPFERLRGGKGTLNYSPEDIQRKLKFQYETNFKEIERSLTGPRLRRAKGDSETNRASSPPASPQDERDASETSRLMWQKSMDASRIKQLYREAKGEFKKPGGNAEWETGRQTERGSDDKETVV